MSDIDFESPAEELDDTFESTIKQLRALSPSSAPILPTLPPRYTAVDIGIDAEVQFLRRVLFQRDCFVTAALPFGYASFSIFKIGGGFDHTDTSIALGLSGASVGMGLLALPFLRMNKPKWLFGHSILLSTLSLATTFAFYKIDKISGLCTLPFSFLSLYYMGLWGKTVCCGAKTSTV